jgi:hypothetical protein
MTKKLKSLQAIFVMTILFAGLFIVTPPAPSQGKLINLGLVNLSSLVDVNYSAADIEDPIVPRGKPSTLSVKVEYSISKGGYLPPAFSDLALRMYSGLRAIVQLDIVDKPEWAEVSLDKGDVTFLISDGAPQERTIVMTVTLDEDAPGYLQGNIKIKAQVVTMEKIFVPPIQGFTKTFTLPVFPEFNPLVDPQVSENTKRIGPMDTAVFPIEIQNEGNERTTVFFSVKNLPKDWKAIITNSINLESGEKSTVYLSVQPPRGFGYHYDSETIDVEVLPVRAQDKSNQGIPQTVSVLVESRGFSFYGFELVLIPLVIIIAIAVFIFYYFKKWKPQR